MTLPRCFIQWRLGSGGSPCEIQHLPTPLSFRSQSVPTFFLRLSWNEQKSEILE